MRRTVITVVAMASMPGSYEITVQNRRGRIVVGRHGAGRDPGAAAAKAMQMAVEHGAGGYQIFAPQAVATLIPADMLGRTN